jgi:hypothetical protein
MQLNQMVCQIPLKQNAHIPAACPWLILALQEMRPGRAEDDGMISFRRQPGRD